MHYLFFLDNLVRDFRYALRNLRKDRRFAIVAVFAMALGIGASTVMFSVVYNVLFLGMSDNQIGYAISLHEWVAC